MTMYWVVSAFNGVPPGSSAVPGRNDGSVFSLQRALTTPSQSMSMSAFQKTAPVTPPHTAMLRLPPSSVAYRPFEIRRHIFTLASSCPAVGAISPTLAGLTAAGAPVDATTGITTADNARTPMPNGQRQEHRQWDAVTDRV